MVKTKQLGVLKLDKSSQIYKPLSIIDKIDLLRKHIHSKEGKKLLTEIRKDAKFHNKYSSTLSTYLADTLDGMSPEQSARELKLL